MENIRKVDSGKVQFLNDKLVSSDLQRVKYRPITNVKYLEHSKRYDVGLKGRQIGSHQWAFDYDHDL